MDIIDRTAGSNDIMVPLSMLADGTPFMFEGYKYLKVRPPQNGEVTLSVTRKGFNDGKDDTEIMQDDGTVIYSVDRFTARNERVTFAVNLKSGTMRMLTEDTRVFIIEGEFVYRGVRAFDPDRRFSENKKDNG